MVFFWPGCFKDKFTVFDIISNKTRTFKNRKKKRGKFGVKIFYNETDTFLIERFRNANEKLASPSKNIRPLKIGLLFRNETKMKREKVTRQRLVSLVFFCFVLKYMIKENIQNLTESCNCSLFYTPNL